MVYLLPNTVEEGPSIPTHRHRLPQQTHVSVPETPSFPPSLATKRRWRALAWSKPAYLDLPHVPKQGPAQSFGNGPGSKDSQLCHLHGLPPKQPVLILLFMGRAATDNAKKMDMAVIQ